MPEFLPGLELARGFYVDIVGPLLGGIRHSAARLGEGSDVLGFDTPRSTDHGWGPRLQVFVAATDVAAAVDGIERGLPDAYRGWPVRFGWDEVPVSHHVDVDTIDGWLDRRLALPRPPAMGVGDWLATPQQLLLEATSGEAFHDGLDELRRVREELAWYPDQVWRWLLACQWQRIGQEEAFVGRTAEVGDELGSRLIIGRLARDLVRLCFLIERRYAPYSKWLGSAFGRLAAADEVRPALERAVEAGDFAARQAAMTEAYEAVARRHNALELTGPVEASIRPFHGRPYLVIGASRFVEACLATVDDPILRSLPLVGGIDQLADSTDMATPRAARAARGLFDAATRGANDRAEADA
jgi:hypothetical protein